VIVVSTVLPFVDCSHSPTQPTTPPAHSPAPAQTPLPADGICSVPAWPQCVQRIWHAESTVVGVSATLNSCPVDNAVGQTRSVDWADDENPSRSSILLQESAASFDPQHPPDFMADAQTPLYFGSRTGDQFTTIAEQDGMPTCFVWHGDFSGSFSPDGLTFDADESITYTHFGENDMIVRRHWKGIRIESSLRSAPE
jgi:hypothetical protein